MVFFSSIIYVGATPCGCQKIPPQGGHRDPPLRVTQLYMWGQKMCDYKEFYFDLKKNEVVTKEHKCTRRSSGEKDEDGKKYCIFHSKEENKSGF